MHDDECMTAILNSAIGGDAGHHRWSIVDG